MKNGVALLIIGGILISVGLVLLIMNYHLTSIFLFGVASIILLSGMGITKKFQGQPIGRRSRIKTNY